jgi:hypothetical protein
VTTLRSCVAALNNLDSPEPDGADAQPVSTTATARVRAAAIRNLPTPTIGDPARLTISTP